MEPSKARGEVLAYLSLLEKLQSRIRQLPVFRVDSYRAVIFKDLVTMLESEERAWKSRLNYLSLNSITLTRSTATYSLQGGTESGALFRTEVVQRELTDAMKNSNPWGAVERLLNEQHLSGYTYPVAEG